MVEKLMPVIEYLKRYFAFISETNKSINNIWGIVIPNVHIMPKSYSPITSIINATNALMQLIQVN